MVGKTYCFLKNSTWADSGLGGALYLAPEGGAQGVVGTQHRGVRQCPKLETCLYMKGAGPGAGCPGVGIFQTAGAGFRGFTEEAEHFKAAGTSARTPQQLGATTSASSVGDVLPWRTQKRYAAFLSHHQRDSA